MAKKADKINKPIQTQILFWTKVAVMVDLGAPLFSCVEKAFETTDDPNLLQAISMWILENKDRDAYEGLTPLSEALDAFVDFFPPFIISALQAAEGTRTRQNVYRLLVEYLEKERQYGS
ncbi:MAG: hypothetical protein B6244_02385 [Candidatus Cloacimonetes bacterium 4572_55]|nr:MAG: hypothetical protein B6244_02385 [Candidatus Cloacimonetes bacterium 4572_55]